VPHIIEPAPSGRAKCRGCGKSIAKGDLRMGERMPNAFGEGEMTLWFHLPCAAYKRPQPFLDALQTASGAGDTTALEAAARNGLEHRRVPRVDGAQRSPSARSHCRHCREPIDKDTWRVRLVFYEEGRFEPSGYLHLECAPEYFETPAILDRVAHFSPELTEADLADIRARMPEAT
jgi:hypothetical protein